MRSQGIQNVEEASRQNILYPRIPVLTRRPWISDATNVMAISGRVNNKSLATFCIPRPGAMAFSTCSGGLAAGDDSRVRDREASRFEIRHHESPKRSGRCRIQSRRVSAASHLPTAQHGKRSAKWPSRAELELKPMGTIGP